MDALRARIRKKTAIPTDIGRTRPQSPQEQQSKEIDRNVIHLRTCIAILKRIHREWQEYCQRYKDYSVARHYRQRSPISALYLQTFHPQLFGKATRECSGRLPNPDDSSWVELIKRHPNYIKSRVTPYQTLGKHIKRQASPPSGGGGLPPPSSTIPPIPPAPRTVPIVPPPVIPPVTPPVPPPAAPPIIPPGVPPATPPVTPVTPPVPPPIAPPQMFQFEDIVPLLSALPLSPMDTNSETSKEIMPMPISPIVPTTIPPIGSRETTGILPSRAPSPEITKLPGLPSFELQDLPAVNDNESPEETPPIGPSVTTPRRRPPLPENPHTYPAENYDSPDPEMKRFLESIPPSQSVTHPVSPSQPDSPTKRLKTLPTTYATPIQSPLGQSSTLTPAPIR